MHQTDEENSGDAVAMVSGEVDGVEDVVVVNGGEVVSMVNGDTHKKGRWSFPPQLEDFDLMSTDIDPAELELMFSDDRWALIRHFQHPSHVYISILADWWRYIWNWNQTALVWESALLGAVGRPVGTSPSLSRGFFLTVWPREMVASSQEMNC